MSDLTVFAGADAREAVAAGLARWLPAQRWFAGKARALAGVVVDDIAVLEWDGVTVVDLFCDVAFSDGHRERYQVPLASPPEGTDERWLVSAGPVRAADATVVPEAARLLAAIAAPRADQGGRYSAGGATVTGHALGAGADPSTLGPARRLSAEQSNTSVIYGDELILKLFRRLEAGTNPDVEVTRALTAAGFAHVPAQRGALELTEVDGTTTALAVLSDFVAGGREGWQLAVEEVARLRESPVGCALADPVLHDAAADLGRAVAGMHAALRSAFGHRPLTGDDVMAWAPAMRAQLERVLATASRLARGAAAAVVDRGEQLMARHEHLLASAAGGELVRIHGDLHLGQVLLDQGERWQLLDFEGEPSRTLEERRAPSAALRDVAGMLRSFDYAAATSAVEGVLPDAAVAWRDEARRRFLDGYLSEAEAGEFLPAGEHAVAAQLDLFELDKAIYELGYELANRPTWVGVPVGGILRLLDSRSSLRRSPFVDISPCLPPHLPL